MSNPSSSAALSRRSLLRFGSLLAAGGAVGGALTYTGAAPSQAAANIHWTEQQTKGSDGLLSGIAVSGSTGWAVGSIGDGDDLQPLAMKLTNRAWQPTAQPAPDLASLASVAIVSDREVWAVGKQLSDKGLHPVIVRWDGSAWHKIAYPAKIGGLDHVVVAAGSVWVAGWARIGDAEHAVVYRRTGNGAWKRLDKGLETSINVNCLQVFDDGTAWAGLNPGLAHFDGKSWTPATEWPQDGSMISSRFIANSATDIYVAGVAYNGNSRTTPLISHFNGKKWKTLKTPKINGQLYDLAYYDQQVIAVGERFDDQGATSQLLLRGDTSGFSVETPPTTDPGGLLALCTVSGREVITAGYRDHAEGQTPYVAVSQSRWTG